ncbi:unnamed protein product, partial [Pylaiella littoralis]
MKVRSTEGNCVGVSSCLEEICSGFNCVCWAPDGSDLTECAEGTSTRRCLDYDGGECDEIQDFEPLLAASFFLHCIIVALASVAVCLA